jgi:hemerythrin
MPSRWDDAAMSTGLSDIDGQHQEWIRQTNEFDQAVSNGMGIDNIFNTLALLVQYTDLHFSREEDRMLACGCPALAENRRAHDNFRFRLDELLNWLKEEQPTSVEIVTLKQELETWVTNHICTIDIKLRECQ